MGGAGGRVSFGARRPLRAHPVRDRHDAVLVVLLIPEIAPWLPSVL